MEISAEELIKQFIHFVDASIHTLLFKHRCYPDFHFTQCRFSDTCPIVVYRHRHPRVCDYIDRQLKQSIEYLRDGSLAGIQLQILDIDDTKCYEWLVQESLRMQQVRQEFQQHVPLDDLLNSVKAEVDTGNCEMLDQVMGAVLGRLLQHISEPESDPDDQTNPSWRLCFKLNSPTNSYWSTNKSKLAQTVWLPDDEIKSDNSPDIYKQVYAMDFDMFRWSLRTKLM